MDDHFSQINKLLQEELAKQKPSPKKRWSRRLIWIGILMVFVLAIIFSYKNASSPPPTPFVKSIEKTGATIQAAIRETPTNLFKSLSQPKNFLLLGIPGPGNDAPELTDTIALAMVKPEPIKVTLVSIPRDLWVKIPESESYSKINSLYVLGKQAKNQDYGLELIQQKVEQITGQKIDYYFLVDLSVVKELVDQQGGINLMVKKDIYDPLFPGANHSYQTFEIKAGWRYLDGETTVKYIRTRHSPEGDFDRIERQQQVLEALKQKIITLNPIWDLPELLKIANEIYSKIKTDFPVSEIPQFWSIAKKVSPPDILNLVIEKENNLITSYPLLLDNQPVSALQPKAGVEDYSQIQRFIAEAINL